MQSVSLSGFARGPVVVIALLTVAPPAMATDIVGVGQAAAELPQVYVIHRRPVVDAQGFPVPPDATTPLGTFGLYNPLLAYLDTGASGNLIASATANALLGLGINNETYGDPPQPVLFFDTGATETGAYHVSEPLWTEVANYPGPASFDPNLNDLDPINAAFRPIAPGPVRSQMTPQPTSIFELSTVDIIGMPAMAGRVTVIDNRLYNRGFDLNDPNAPVPSLRTYIFDHGTAYNPAADDVLAEVEPGIPQTERTVKLTFDNFDAFSGTEPNAPGTPRPITAENPFIGASPLDPDAPGAPPGVTLSRDGRPPSDDPITGNFLLDTGAQVSFMSSEKAAALGVVAFDPATGDEVFDDDGYPVLFDSQTGNAVAKFTALVQGASGEATPVSGFSITSMSIPTVEGDPLVFFDASFLILDVTLTDADGVQTTIDGAVGSTFLAPSFDLNQLDPIGSAFDWVVFDAVENELRFTFAEYVPEPSALPAVLLAAGLLRRRARRPAAAAL